MGKLNTNSTAFFSFSQVDLKVLTINEISFIANLWRTMAEKLVK